MPWLEIIESRSGDSHQFAPGAIIAGRGEACDLQLADTSISRFHALLFAEGGRWHIRDLRSSNGVTVWQGGAELIPGLAQHDGTVDLRDGDTVELGDVELRIRLTAPLDSPARSLAEVVKRVVRASELPASHLVVRETTFSLTHLLGQGDPLADAECLGVLHGAQSTFHIPHHFGSEGFTQVWLINGDQYAGLSALEPTALDGLVEEPASRNGWRQACACPIDTDETADLLKTINRMLGWSKMTRTVAGVGAQPVWFSDHWGSWSRRASAASHWVFFTPASTADSRAARSEFARALRGGDTDERWWLCGTDYFTAAATNAREEEIRRLNSELRCTELLVHRAGDEPEAWLEAFRTRGSRVATLDSISTPIARLLAEVDSSHFENPEVELPALLEGTLRTVAMLAVSFAVRGALEGGGRVILDWDWKRTGASNAMLFLLKRLEKAEVPKVLTSIGRGELGRCLRRAVGRRNQLVHERSDSPALIEDTEVVSAALQTLLEHLATLPAELLQVRAVRPLRGSAGPRPRLKIEARMLKGMFPRPYQEEVVEGALLDPGLWMRSTDGWYRLSPILDWVQCGSCGRWDLFVMRRFSTKDGIASVEQRGLSHGRHVRTIDVRLDESPELAALDS
ncbi:MAG: FHA domain-containing protein [Deltaproteobacteria bacterium]|nr:FHA domain-containing protein [Deltaproteobacteria bacterium]